MLFRKPMHAYLAHRMKQVLYSLFVSCFLLVSVHSHAQLVTSNAPPYDDPIYLVEQVLLGTGVIATNITYTGHSTAIGYFDGSNSNIGLPTGIILSTGNISTAVGPNTMGGAGTDHNLPGDNTLTSISGNQTFDAAVLEFDFDVTADTLSFNYVFGSEEYMEFVNGGVNDAFGFFITGPNPSGGTYVNQNVALIPGTTTPISINNVNANSNGTYYFNNEFPAGATVEYDGFTVSLKANAPVVCGANYHIKMAIADGGDGVFDSGVFLESGSFTSSGGLEIQPQASFDFGGLLDTAVVEGCSQVTIDIERIGLIDDSIVVRIGTGGSAINGVDYQSLPDSIIMGPGVRDTFLQIIPIVDGVVEPIEDLELYLQPVGDVCIPEFDDTLRYVVIDEPILDQVVNLRDTLVHCPEDSVLLTVAGQGGLGFYKYQWSNGSADDSIYVSPANSSWYSVSTTDTCGRQLLIDSILVEVPVYQALTVHVPDTFVCPGDVLRLAAEFSGGDGNYNFTWSDGANQFYTVIAPLESGYYKLMMDDGCGLSEEDSAFVLVPDSAFPSFDYVSLPAEPVQFINQSVNAHSYHWYFGDGFTSTEMNPIHNYRDPGFYDVRLRVYTEEGCYYDTYFTVKVYPDFTVYIPTAFNPYSSGENASWGPDGILFKYYDLLIYNRWGEIIFEVDNGLGRWDGRVNGKVVPPGVYAYHVKLVGTEGEVQRKAGTVTVIY